MSDSLLTCDGVFDVTVTIATARPILSRTSTRFVRVSASGPAEAIELASLLVHVSSAAFGNHASVSPISATITGVRF